MYDFTFLIGAALLIPFSIFIVYLLRYLSSLRMNYEPVCTDEEATSEAEDLTFSDSEELGPAEKGILSIDYNARIVSVETDCVHEGDNCDTHFRNNAKFNFHRKSENRLDTSTEELNVSDEEGLCCKPLTMQCLNLDGTVSIIPRSNKNSSLSYSSTTVLKEGYATDAEELSDEESDQIPEKTEKDLYQFDKPLTIAGLKTAVKPASLGSPSAANKSLSDFNVMCAFSDSLILDEGNLAEFNEEPQMTCMEFLNDEFSDDGNLTDAEDVLIGSADEVESEPQQNVWKPGVKVTNNASSSKDSLLVCPGDSRKSSGGFLTEDEIFCVDDSYNSGKKKKKRHSLKIVPKEGVSDDCDTDEEILEENGEEWTETDESGGVRQITQIKTETSIKLEGEGAVHSLRKVPKKEPSDERKSSTDSEQEDLSFSEKKSMFQRLSLTSDTLPKGNKWTTEVNMDELPMAHGEIVHEQISFHEKLKMFEPDEDNRKKIQKREKSDQPTVYKYDFTKSPIEKPVPPEVVASELGKMKEMAQQIAEELAMEEDSLNEPHPDLSEGVRSRSEQESALTPDKVEQEASSLVAGVDQEEREISTSVRRMSCSRTDSDKSSNINSRIFDTESEKGSGSSDFAALSPDAVQESSTTTEFHVTYSEMDVIMQDGDKVTVFESKSQEKLTDVEHFTEVTSEVDVEDYVSTDQAEPIVESPLCTNVQVQEPTFEIGSDGIAVYTITEETSCKKLSLDLLKKDKFKEAVKLDEDESESEIVHHADRPSKLLDLSAVDSHIKSEILREEIDQSLEESPLEVKRIAEDLEAISGFGDHKQDVYKLIRTEILTQVLSEDIESGSPEKKELSVLSPTERSSLMSDSNGHGFDSTSVTKGLAESVADIKPGDDAHKKHKQLSPQISQDSACQPDEISSESIAVEPDEHMVEYDEAFGEHSLTEQLKALASAAVTADFDADNLDASGFEFDHASAAMSSSMSDLEIQRRAKELYSSSRLEKKEIRSLKSTKQVSTIEEHSSIESCDSPLDFVLHETEKLISESSEAEAKYFGEANQENIDKPASSESTKSDSIGSKNDKENLADQKSMVDAEASDIVDVSPRKSGESSEKSDRLSRSDSKSSQGKKSDSDVEGSKAESGVKESCSSSGESPYYSVETSDSGKTPRSTPAASRPCSSEYDVNVFSGQGSEYETCVTSQEASGEGSGSYVTAISSQEISYATACSSFSHSSRESAYSVDSESSGHLASIEVSSEASETLVPSAQEMECDIGPGFEMPVLDEEPSAEEGLKEPYEMDIPESVIRNGIEIPFMKNWGLKDPAENDDDRVEQLPQGWSWQYAAESEILDKFEVLDCTNNADKTSDLPTASIRTVGDGPSHTTAVSDAAKTFTPPETVTSVREGHGHRRMCSSVFDIVPEKESIEPAGPIDEEQLSVSESSATHSEQTWQTNSIDTAVQISAQAPVSCMVNESSSLVSASDSFQETPPDKELTPEQSAGVQPDSYLQLNGPIEVDYNPDYDNPEGHNPELNSNQQVPHFDGDGLQFDLEIDSFFNASAAAGTVPNGGAADIEMSNGLAVEDNYSIPPSAGFDLHGGGTSDAEKPEAQQEQSFTFNGYNGHHEAESSICPDLASYLPESDQGDLLSAGDSLPPSYESENNFQCGQSSNTVEAIENHCQSLVDHQSLEAAERTDVVDTSPEDERYEYKSLRSDKYVEDNAYSPKCENDGLAESDYVPPAYASKFDDPANAELYTHREEEEFELRESDVDPSPNPSIDDKHSTPSSDVLYGRRFFPRSGDTSAASSLQEFERLEADIAAGRTSRSSIDSNERITKSGEHDDVSMSSLTEFEKLEKETIDAESGDKIPVEMMLSEIEEGIESQCSDVLEVLPESLHESECSEYEKRRLEMEEVIKTAQSNVEKFQDETTSEAITSDECTVVMRVLSDEADTPDNTREISIKDDGFTDVESEMFANTLDVDTAGGHSSSSSGEKNQNKGDCMLSSTDSIDPSSSTATHATYQFDTDSVMSSSINSAQASGEECTMVSSTDTLEPEPKLTYSQGDLLEDKSNPSGGTKDSFQCRLDELKQLEASNGAKEQMEMFLSKLTDESVLMDDFPLNSFSDSVHESEPLDEILKSSEDVQGISNTGEDVEFGGDEVISQRTTTTTRIVTTVTTDGEEEVQSEEHVEHEGDDLRHSVEVILNQFMSDSDVPKLDDSATEHDE